jgi:hypothetical protein
MTPDTEAAVLIETARLAIGEAVDRRITHPEDVANHAITRL